VPLSDLKAQKEWLMPLLPELIVTPRLHLRVPEAADSVELNATVSASFSELTPWLPWAQEPQTLADSEEYCRRSREKWLADECLNLLMVTKSDGAIIGGTGYPRLDWKVPRFEIGYWCSTAAVGGGYVTEATYALAAYAFSELSAARVELRVDDLNESSWRVAQRLGFRLEGVLRSDTRDASGRLRDTRVYGAVALQDLRSNGPAAG